MTCQLIHEISERDAPGPDAERELGRHLSGCDFCARDTARDALLADALVAAASDASRFRARTRRVVGVGAAVSLAASVILFVSAGHRPTVVYVIQGDSTGVSLTGPGVSRRSETPTRPVPRHGDRT